MKLIAQNWGWSQLQWNLAIMDLRATTRVVFCSKNLILFMYKLKEINELGVWQNLRSEIFHYCRALLKWTELIARLRLAELIAPVLKKLPLISRFEETTADCPWYIHISSTPSFENTGAGWGLGNFISIYMAILDIVFKKIYCWYDCWGSNQAFHCHN